jgi:hypothetical protein
VEVVMEKVKVVLGGDPEFELVRVNVADLLRVEVALPWGAIGKEGEFLLELRPLPSLKPETLVGRVGRLLLMVPRVLGAVPSTACRRYPTGGHVHIGGVPVEAREGVAKAVDEALGDLFHSLNTETRLSVGYGRRGDWRPQPWGVEYRTPPASLWSHPEVALTFLRAIKWVAEKFLSGEEPLKDPAWPLVRAGAEKAAAFVREHGGKLHWGAWKEYVGEANLREGLEVGVALEPRTECDGEFLGDLRAMLARLGIPSAKVAPLDRERGECASNVPGYGELPEGLEPYAPGGRLALSWRLRNDPLFRRAEIPKLEGAIARLLERLEEEGGDFLVREAAHLSVDWPPELEAEGAEEDWDPDSEVYACDECGAPVPYPELHRGERGRAYCPECWEEEYALCRGCGRVLRRYQARHDRNGRAYCGECYDSLYVICSSCDVEIATDEARFDEVGEAYCEECYSERYAVCEECGEEVAWDEVEEVDGLAYCPSCYASLEEDEEAVLEE